MSDTTEPTTEELPEVYTEEEIKRVAEMLNSGIAPVSTHALDEAIQLIEVLSDTLDNIYANKSFGKEDFLALKDLWDQYWVVKERYPDMENESKHLGLFDKISLGVKGFKALNKLFKSIKRARS